MADSQTIWTVASILSWIEDYLRAHGDANPKLSASWLVGDALGMSRMELLLNSDTPLSAEERAVLRDYTLRRGAGEPLQYITGTTDFRFITVRVADGVLIPRPETEVLVSEALAVLPHRDNPYTSGALGPIEPIRVIDACTGSGCIACSIAHEVPAAYVQACDLDEAAVHLTRENIHNLGLEGRVEVHCSDLLDRIPEAGTGVYDLVVSNPPYIPTAVLATLDEEVTRYENALALDGGEDGLDLFRPLAKQAYSALKPGGYLAVELHETCLDEASGIARAAGFETTRIVADLAGKPRVLIAGKGE